MDTRPLAKDSVAHPCCGRNSTTQLASLPATAHLADAGQFPLKHETKKQTPKL